MLWHLGTTSKNTGFAKPPDETYSIAAVGSSSHLGTVGSPRVASAKQGSSREHQPRPPICGYTPAGNAAFTKPREEQRHHPAAKHSQLIWPQHGKLCIVSPNPAAELWLLQHLNKEQHRAGPSRLAVPVLQAGTGEPWLDPAKPW